MSMIPEGTYSAVVIEDDVQWGYTQKGNEQIAVGVRITRGPHEGRQLAWRGYFTEKTEERTLQSLRYMGWQGNNVTELGPLTNEFSIVVKHEEYDGKTFARIAWINSAGGGRIKLQQPMDAKQLRQFAATMKAKAAAIDEVDGAPPAETSDEPPPAEDGDPGADDDDVPF